jgi:hypothetical protein
MKPQNQHKNENPKPNTKMKPQKNKKQINCFLFFTSCYHYSNTIGLLVHSIANEKNFVPRHMH